MLFCTVKFAFQFLFIIYIKLIWKTSNDTITVGFLSDLLDMLLSQHENHSGDRFKEKSLVKVARLKRLTGAIKERVDKILYYKV